MTGNNKREELHGKENDEWSDAKYLISSQYLEIFHVDYGNIAYDNIALLWGIEKAGWCLG